MDRKPTDAELAVLQILWAHGPSSVRFVNTELSKKREVVYTTTLKMMQVMTEKKGFLKREWGALYASDHNGMAASSQAGSRDGFYDYQKRTNSLDVYSTRLPQPEEEFIADYSKDIENVNFTFMGYDSYQVNTQGLSGAMKPHLFQNTTIFGKGDRTQNESGKDLHVFWHRGTINEAADRKFGSGNRTFSPLTFEPPFHYGMQASVSWCFFAI